MTGELNEWSRSAPIGETHYFDFELFKNCVDTNIIAGEVDRKSRRNLALCWCFLSL